MAYELDSSPKQCVRPDITAAVQACMRAEEAGDDHYPLDALALIEREAQERMCTSDEVIAQERARINTARELRGMTGSFAAAHETILLLEQYYDEQRTAGVAVSDEAQMRAARPYTIGVASILALGVDYHMPQPQTETLPENQ